MYTVYKIIDLRDNIVVYIGRTKKKTKALDIDKSLICACCRDKRKSAGGFVWKYN